MAKNIIEIRDFTASYGKENVLEDINIEFENDKFYCLLGENGSGKTTLFKHILGSIKAKSGNIFIDGEDIFSFNSIALSKYISYIPQAIRGEFNFLCIDAALFGLAGEIKLLKTPSEKDIKKCVETFEYLNITHLLHKNLMEISGGERQMVYIARAIIKDTPIILMDEPTSSLDYKNQLTVMKIARDFAHKGKAVIMSIHNPLLACLYADEVIALKNKKIFYRGNFTEMDSASILSKLYNEDILLLESSGRKIPVPKKF